MCKNLKNSTSRFFKTGPLPNLRTFSLDISPLLLYTPEIPSSVYSSFEGALLSPNDASIPAVASLWQDLSHPLCPLSIFQSPVQLPFLGSIPQCPSSFFPSYTLNILPVLHSSCFTAGFLFTQHLPHLTVSLLVVHIVFCHGILAHRGG